MGKAENAVNQLRNKVGLFSRHIRYDQIRLDANVLLGHEVFLRPSVARRCGLRYHAPSNSNNPCDSKGLIRKPFITHIRPHVIAG